LPRPEEHSNADAPLAPGEAEQIAETMRAFTASSRVRILYALLREPLTVDRLADQVGLEASAVSQQLRVLRQLGFIAKHREGRFVRYRLHDHHVEDLLAAIRHSREHVSEGWSSAPAPPAEIRETGR
jgi:DNA-binding transcriptional ArsR family regulator